MSKKRGLSVEEKRSRMMDLFYQKKEFFLLKELEKIAPKEKGITSQTVKEIVQSLVDDDLVDTDKIGTSVYFWAFPSKATAVRAAKKAKVEREREDAEKRKQLGAEALEEAEKGREDTDERRKALSELKSLRERRASLQSSLQKYRDCDPAVLEQLKQETLSAGTGANRWTDNIYALHSWVGNKFPSISVTELNKQFGVPEDLDYV